MLDVMIPILISAFAFIGLIFARKIAEKKIDDIVKDGKPNKIVLPLVLIIVAGLVYAGFNYYIKTFDPPAGGFEVTLVYKPIETKQPEVAVQTAVPVQENAAPTMNKTEESSEKEQDISWYWDWVITMVSFIVSVILLCIGVILNLIEVINNKNRTAAKFKAGDYITFGHYKQDADESKEPKPIKWLVLDVQENKALLLSRYILDAQRYNTAFENVTWENCTLRKWLNDSFIKTAFSAEEQNAILLTNVDNSQKQRNRYWNSLGGDNTQDKVFLLSYTETQKYFSSDNARISTPTKYANTQSSDSK